MAKKRANKGRAPKTPKPAGGEPRSRKRARTTRRTPAARPARAEPAPRPRPRRAPAPAPVADLPPAPAPPADLGPAPSPVLGDIPWGYGVDRVTAMARDPHWLFVSWEVTDEALARARAAVGDPEAACTLRVYDTTYRLFDGTNANWWMDVAVHRPANNHYVRVGRPACTFHVDFGVRSRDGRFATVARSGPAETPRDSVSPDTRVEWMTVAPEGAPPPAYAHRFVPAAARAPRGPAPAEAAPAPDLGRVLAGLVGEAWQEAGFVEAGAGGPGVRWVRWTGPFWREHWRLVRPGARVTVEIVLEGGRQVVRAEADERVLVGPWHVTVTMPGPEGQRRVVAHWTVHYAWPTAAGAVRVETAAILRRIAAGYRAHLVAASSEARLVGEAWSSEAMLAGASEWAWGGASEWAWGGASEFVWGGASEWAWPGASELFLGGASEATGGRRP